MEELLYRMLEFVQTKTYKSMLSREAGGTITPQNCPSRTLGLTLEADVNIHFVTIPTKVALQ